ncbi:MAG: TRAP transporter small permease [Proteobacteria bacterium]|nr:TRAP transporter small permease [Pseudomonadota bacterium]MDA1323127.1 TRAP transporter small permease [Pseudomonadota bacterium]
MIDLVSAAARFLTRVAAVFLLAMVAINVVDVGLREGLNAPIFGTHEIVVFMLAAVAFLAIPEVFLRDQHITIELIDQVIPDRAANWLRAFGSLCALVYIVLLAWFMGQPALDYIEFNEITMDLQIPLIWQAALILTGMATAAIAAFVLLLRDIGRATGQDGGRDGRRTE